MAHTLFLTATDTITNETRDSLESLIDRIGLTATVELPAEVAEPEVAEPEADMDKTLTVKQWMAREGFDKEQTGGGCTAYIRDDGQISEILTLTLDSIAPTSWDDRVTLTTSDVTSDVYPSEDCDNVPLWALRDAIDGCNCFALAGLRWANASHIDCHDETCKAQMFHAFY